ncbi:hypothetical protein AMATHDRAFT_138014, partial [Amanita thiersii Skay4041]
HLLAVGTTVFRLVYRFKASRQWWDDYWAAFALVLDFGMFTSLWLRPTGNGPSSLLDIDVRIARYWISALFYPSVVWASRISLGLSILRIIPFNTIRRRVLVLIISSFSLMWLALMLQKIIKCTTDTSWHNNKAVQCYLGDAIGIITLCTDVFADACLIIIPVGMIKKLNLPKPERRLLYIIFGASILSTMASIVYSTFVFQADRFNPNMRGSLIGLTSHIKATVTLMVCNMLIIIPYIHRLFKQDEEDWELTVTFDAGAASRGVKASNTQQSKTLVGIIPSVGKQGESRTADGSRCEIARDSWSEKEERV